MNYDEFIQAKIAFAKPLGIEIDPAEVHPLLKPHQRDTVAWACHGGRRGIFLRFGLGKSLIQLSICDLMTKHIGPDARALIVCPLGVRQEFARDAKMIGLRTEFIQSLYDKDVHEKQTAFIELGRPIYVTNYESVRNGKLDPTGFDVVCLDEAAILRGFGGTKTFRTMMQLFEGTSTYRFVATATPDPNEYLELAAYADWLGIMETGEVKTRFFKRDSTKADNLTLHPHKEAEFWKWVSTWALFMQSPSDLGHDDTGYDLPPLEVRWHEIPTDHSRAIPDRNGQRKMFNDASMGLSEAASEKRNSMHDRIDKMKEIVLSESPKDNFMLWCDLEAERKVIEKALPGCVSVYGSQKWEPREKAILDFSEGRLQYLSSKASMLGAGVNLQRHCHRACFVGIGFKFNDFIQSIHRIYRFLQAEKVTIDLIYTEAEIGVRKVLEDKWQRYDDQCRHMAKLIREFGLASAKIIAAERTSTVERNEVAEEKYRVVNNDCVDETSRMDDDSVGLIVSSIPFAFQYEYTPCYDEQTEVLTRRGWRLFCDLRITDYLATVNPSLKLEWQKPTELVWKRYTGPMVHFEQRNSFDLLVTPDHKMFVDTRVGNRETGRKHREFKLIPAKDMVSEFKHRKWSMAATAQSKSISHPEFVKIPPVAKRSSCKPQISTIRTEDLIELAGWYISEGCVGKDAVVNSCDRCGKECKPDSRWCSASCRSAAADDRRSGVGTVQYQFQIAAKKRPRTSGKRGAVSISQCRSANPQNCFRIRKLLERIGIKFRENERGFEFWDINVASFLRNEFGSGSHNKKIPRWMKDLDAGLLSLLRDTLMKGDGSKTGYSYCSYSAQLRDDFQEICLLTGWRVNVDDENKVVGIGQTNIFPEVRDEPKVVEYDGMIGCATVPNHTLVVRRNGCAIVSGNSFLDFGHTDSNEHFWKQMDFLSPHLFRVLQPGRVFCCHVKDRIVSGGISGFGFQTLHPFHAEAIAHYQRHGFAFLGMKTVVTDVVRENNQTYRLGWSEQCKDGSRMGCGVPEYVLLFRKPPTDRSNGYADVPVLKSKPDMLTPDGEVVPFDSAKKEFDANQTIPGTGYSRARWQFDAHGFQRSSGNRFLAPKEIEELPHHAIFKRWREESLSHIYDFERHLELGEIMERDKRLPSTFMNLPPHSWHPDVWTDVARMRTLNMIQQRKGQQQHLCPLQFDIVDRLIVQLSNPGDVVYDPFGGLMTVPYCAIKLGRFGVGCELNPGYFADGVRYCQSAAIGNDTPTLFNLDDDEEEISVDEIENENEPEPESENESTPEPVAAYDDF